jgi:uncharacterized protein YdaU (DUF1376 family)
VSKGMQYVPWYHGDFLRSTAGWTLTERAAYWMLLCAQWELGQLPREMPRLASIAGISVEEITAAWKFVGPKFTETDAGLINPRMDERRREYMAYREKQSESGKKGMNARWHKGEADKPTEEQLAYEGKEFHDQVIAAYHEILPKLPPVRSWPKSRASNLNARIRDRLADGKPADTVEYWRGFFTNVRACDFLCGRSENGWRASLPWMIESEENFTKVIEGQYDSRKKSGSGELRSFVTDALTGEKHYFD